MSGYTDFFNSKSLPNLALYTAAGALTACCTGHAIATGAAFGLISEIFSQATKNLGKKIEKLVPDEGVQSGIRFCVITGLSTLSVNALAMTRFLHNPISIATGFTFSVGIFIADRAWTYLKS